ncbi:E3 ubiquitin-protein ligase HOS1 isoform X1 [Vigna radiata var. radiata]|uniref:E3 ubiquitin-protein ligase HOS1 isoform X1 n=1 Tax=Vigna radiata var. radiata TaxID=3916 RepID=A0A1S3VS86_VIGRR|nr:E3 ubiquitin-protein ligase HOS1 isoform X1 [Vigna radiata var. radiata]
MDRRLNGLTVSSSSNGGSAAVRSSSPTLQPNYSSRLVQDTLEHLASIDLIDLCKEAKVERCRATRDLRSCGRYVHHVLNSCGHASLCEECSQRCDICPICRVPISKSGAKLHLRLYYECIEAGLISKRFDERFQEIEDGEKQLNADVHHLYSLFDVALENNLVSLICHYITDVCMDETAVSSDPVIAFLLDEVVVKDWCKRTFKNIITELQGIYNMDVYAMKERLSLLLKFSLHLKGISNVLDILDSSFKGTLSAQLHDLHHLQESILKTKQHMDIIIWCIRHEFLEGVRSRFTDNSSWSSDVRMRKSEAIRRSWPDAINQSMESSGHDGSLFIEDALNNLDLEEGFMNGTVEGLEIASLQKDGASFLGSNTDQVLGYYPFKNLRSAADLLFLHGGSDMVIAKQAIFLYYLYDRHWTIPEEEWTFILEDFAATFSISRHSLLESLTFYLLDDHTEEALQEACRLLPEITGPTSHPKIAEVLLERGSPDTALMVLRWAGRDGGPHMTSLRDAVTAVRVRVECGLLTEAFMHQRILSTRVKEKNFNKRASGDASQKLKGQCSNWVEVLVTEICCLCIRRNLVDRMIELPWNSEEEVYIHKCLFDFAIEDPIRTTGNLLVVFYFQRHRYSEAYQVHIKLEKVEQDSISKGSVSEEFLPKLEKAIQWRSNLINRCLELLPEVEQQQLRSGNLTEGAVSSSEEVEVPDKFDIPQIPDSLSTSLLIPSSVNSSLLLHRDHPTGLLSSSTFGTSAKIGMSFPNTGPELGNFGSSSHHHDGLFTSSERVLSHQGKISKNFRFDNTPTNNRIHFMNGSPLKGFKRTSPSNSHDNVSDKVSPGVERNLRFGHNQTTSSPLYSWKAGVNPVTRSTLSYPKEFANDLPNVSGRSVRSHKDDRSWNVGSTDDPMDVSHGLVEKKLNTEENINGGPRWRSDEASDEEYDVNLGRAMDMAYYATPLNRTTRRSRVVRR